MSLLLIIEINWSDYLVRKTSPPTSQIQVFVSKCLISGTLPRFAFILFLSYHLISQSSLNWYTYLRILLLPPGLLPQLGDSSHSSHPFSCKVYIFINYWSDLTRILAQERFRISSHRLDIPHFWGHRPNFILFY